MPGARNLGSIWMCAALAACAGAPAAPVQAEALGSQEECPPSALPTATKFENTFHRIFFGPRVYEQQNLRRSCGLEPFAVCGTWQADGRSVSFREEGAKPPQQALLVTWGQRLYLLRAGELEEFCAAVQKGDEPRTTSSGRFLLRSGDEDVAAEGLPEIPEPWRELTGVPPIETLLVADSRAVPWNLLTPDQRARIGRTSAPEADIAAGSRQGVRPGLRFFTRPAASEYAREASEDAWRVTEVGMDASRAQLEAFPSFESHLGLWIPPSGPVSTSTCPRRRLP